MSTNPELALSSTIKVTLWWVPASLSIHTHGLKPNKPPASSVTRPSGSEGSVDIISIVSLPLQGQGQKEASKALRIQHLKRSPLSGGPHDLGVSTPFKVCAQAPPWPHPSPAPVSDLGLYF